jgi:hypothetical protein
MGIQKIDLRKLDLLEKQNKEILRKLSAIGVKPYSILSTNADTDSSGLLKQLTNVGSSIGSSIGSVFTRKRITIRGLDFYISPEKIPENMIYSKLTNVFGPKIKVQINKRDPREQEVVLIKVEPVGRSPSDTVYNFLEENIKRHILTDKYLYINGNEKVDGDKFNTYIQELNAISNDIVELSDERSYKNFVVVLRLIHMEILKEINKFIKTSSYASSDIVVLPPWCFVDNCVPSIIDSPELKLYSDITDRGLQFINGVVSVLSSGDTEQVYFDENTLRTDLDQSLEAKTDTEKALYTLANTFVDLTKGKKDDNDTLQIMQFIFYTRPTRFPQIVSKGSIQRLESSIKSNIDTLRGSDYFNDGTPGDDSILNPTHFFTDDDIIRSNILKITRPKLKYTFQNKAQINRDHLKSSYIYDTTTNQLKSLDEFTSYLYTIFKKFVLVFDILTNIKDDIPDAIQNEINEVVGMFFDNPYKMMIMTNTERYSLDDERERRLGMDFLKSMVGMNKLFLKQINDTLLYSIKRGLNVNRENISTITTWLDNINRFNNLPKDGYSKFLKDETNNIYYLEYETHVSRGIYNAKQRLDLTQKVPASEPVPVEDTASTGGPATRTRSRLQKQIEAPVPVKEAASTGGPATRTRSRLQKQIEVPVPVPVEDGSEDGAEDGAEDGVPVEDGVLTEESLRARHTRKRSRKSSKRSTLKRKRKQ